jgi:hypothetical protein
MPHDWLRRLLRRFGRPPGRGMGLARIDPTLDARLDRVEHDQREIEARLELLERQADPRRLRRDDY